MTPKISEPSRNLELKNFQRWTYGVPLESYSWNVWRTPWFQRGGKAEIGYIGYSNKKIKIKTNDDLQRAFESDELHKNKIAVFYICKKQEESSSKRLAQDVKHGKYYFITAFCRYFKFFLSFCNINFLNVFLRKCNPSASVPRRQRYWFGRFLEKQEATKAVEGKITAGKNNQTATFHPRR